MIDTFEAVEVWCQRERGLKIAVLTSCTGEKTRALHVTAEQLYTGRHHTHLMDGVRAFREAGGELDLRIVSAGHGIVPSDRVLPYYDRTFGGLGRVRARAYAAELGIPADAERFLTTPVDLRLILLGQDYLDACAFDFETQRTGTTVVITGASYAAKFPETMGLIIVPVSNKHAMQYRCGQFALKGELGARLLRAAATRFSS